MLTKHYINDKGKVTEYWVLISRTFELAGVRFEVVETRITGSGPMAVVHRIRGPGGVKEMTHPQLVAAYKKHWGESKLKNEKHGI